MKRSNKHGYKTTEQHTYVIEVNNNTYSVQVDVELFDKTPDYTTWDSDYDFWGYTEVLEIKITKVYSEDENGGENELEFKLLSEELQDKFYAVIDNLVINENR